MAVELARFSTLLDGLGIAPGDPDRVRHAARRVDDERFASQSRVTTGEHAE